MATTINRTETIKIRVTPEEKRKYALKAKNADMNVAEWFRFLGSSDVPTKQAECKHRFEFAINMAAYINVVQKAYEKNNLDQAVIKLMKEEVYKECQSLNQ